MRNQIEDMVNDNHKDFVKAIISVEKGINDGKLWRSSMTLIWTMTPLILFESAKKYLQEHLGESKTLNISKWKAEIGTMRKEKDSLYSQIKDIQKEVEQAESVRSCIDKLLQEKRGLTQVKKKELEV